MANLFPIIFPFNEDSPEMKKLGIQTEYEVYKKIGKIYDETVDIIYGKEFLNKNFDGSLDKGELTDFLVIHPMKGILLLECKGGLMEYDKNLETWKQNNQLLKKDKDPFEQANNGQYRLINLLKEEFGEKKVLKNGRARKSGQGCLAPLNPIPIPTQSHTPTPNSNPNPHTTKPI